MCYIIDTEQYIMSVLRYSDQISLNELATLKIEVETDRNVLIRYSKPAIDLFISQHNPWFCNFKEEENKFYKTPEADMFFNELGDCEFIPRLVDDAIKEEVESYFSERNPT